MKLYSTFRALGAVLMVTSALAAPVTANAQGQDKMDKMSKMEKMGPVHMSGAFAGVKANTGTVSHSKVGRMNILTLSEDFKIPDAPAPHWQIVDTRGNVYLLQRLEVKGGKANRQITIPSYIKDVAKVQIWCAWAEVLLGEASFDHPIKL